ncbi:MAG TPA: FHA domain-containing protein [Dehalococcoidia bacterium]|nr:FHA domain-containing protein [Dehalococcoidia bacterium]
MSAEWLALFLRILLVLGIYLFLLQVVLIVRRDLGTARPSAAAGPAGAARLVVVDPAESQLLRGQALSLTGVDSIGRAAGNSLRVEDEFVSARHAVLTRRDGTWWIEDLASTNGTYVNGRPVEQPTRVAGGDQVEIGRVRFRLEAG